MALSQLQKKERRTVVIILLGYSNIENSGKIYNKWVAEYTKMLFF